MSSLTQSMTLTVRITGTKRWKLRMWLTLQILKVVRLVCPIKVEAEVCNGPEVSDR